MKLNVVYKGKVYMVRSAAISNYYLITKSLEKLRAGA